MKSRSQLQRTFDWFDSIKDEASHHQSSVHPVWVKTPSWDFLPLVSRVVCRRPVFQNVSLSSVLL